MENNKPETNTNITEVSPLATPSIENTVLNTNTKKPNYRLLIGIVVSILLLISISAFAYLALAINGHLGGQMMNHSPDNIALTSSNTNTNTSSQVECKSTKQSEATDNQLWIPPTITNSDFSLSLNKQTKQFSNDYSSDTYGYNGCDFFGPTLVMNKGDKVTIGVANNLNESTTTHWHGMHVPAAVDGGPHQIIEKGQTWSPSFTVNNNAGTYWYHPHLHMNTMRQLNLGAAGLIIVKDQTESSLDLPREYGVDDIPLILTSRSFVSNQISTSTIYGDVMLANGVRNATKELPSQFVRFRILNAEIERNYNLGFNDNRTFYVISTDGGLLEKPTATSRLVMSPGERYEILVDLSKDKVGSSIKLQSFNGSQPFGFPGGENASSGQFGSLLNNRTFDVLKINVANASSKPTTTIPSQLTTNSFPSESAVSKTRSLRITDKGPGTPFTFNNESYMMMKINQTVTLGATEKWRIINGPTFGHSFHIHDVQFKIISRSSGSIADYEKGWKDTVYVKKDETVEFIAKFDDFADPDNPYMYHCHMSNHEDEGLMGQFIVQ